jgi:hypothetical protein
MVSFKILRSEPFFDRALDAVKFLPILLVALLSSVPTLRAQEASTATGPLIAQSSENRLVWVNTATGIYHYSDTRWYGKTKQGRFMPRRRLGSNDSDRIDTDSDTSALDPKAQRFDSDLRAILLRR